MNKIIGYTIVFTDYNQEICYIGMDKDASGLLYFAEELENRNIFLKLSSAESFLKLVQTDLENVVLTDYEWNSLRVIQVSYLLTELKDLL